MIVKALVNALAKSRPQKMPEKLIELIDDDRNDNSDALLRKTAIEIELSLAVTKIKTYTEQAIDKRKNLNVNSSFDSLKKAVLWDINGSFNVPLNAVKDQYSEIANLYSLIDISAKRDEIATTENAIGDLTRENTSVSGRMGDLIQNDSRSASERMAEINSLGFKSREIDASIKEKRTYLENLKLEIKNIEKTMPEYEAKIKTKLSEIEAAESQLLEKLNASK